jgi:hypothetical protein
MTVLEAVTPFQTGIAALVGFFGICLTLLVNACISGRAARRLREHEQRILRTAFKGEITLLKKTFIYFRTVLDSKPAALTVPLHSRCLIFEANIVNLGLLSEAEVGAILSFYTAIREAEDFAATKFPVTREANLQAPQITFTGAGLEVFRWNLDSRVSEAEKALAALSQRI